jgi:hypothetical protein
VTAGAEDSRSWWDHIQPAASRSPSQAAAFGNNSGGSGSSALDLEVQWNRTGAGVPGMPPDWTVYDDKKLSASLQTITHASAFLRIISAPTSAHRAVNFGAVCAAFSKCASLSLQLMNVSAPAADQQILDRATSLINASLSTLPQAEGLDWLRSPLPVQPSMLPRTPGALAAERGGADVSNAGSGSSSYVITADEQEGDGKLAIAAQLLLISENLICAVHNLVLQGAASAGNGTASSSSISGGDVQKALTVANQFAPHSFIRQVARWIKDLNL